MKRKVFIILAAVLAVMMIASILAPILFAETVHRTLFLPDIPPLALYVVLYAALGALVLLVLIRIILAFRKKK